MFLSRGLLFMAVRGRMREMLAFFNDVWYSGGITSFGWVYSNDLFW